MAGGACIGEVAGTLKEVKLIVVPPSADGLFPDKIEGSYQFHAFIVPAPELRHHGLYLPAVEHAHESRLNDIIVVMSQGNLIASQFLGLAVEITPPHSGTEVAWIFFHLIHCIEDSGFKNGYGNPQDPGIVFDKGPVLPVVAGIHDQKGQPELHQPVPLNLLKKLGHHHRVLATGDAYRNVVPFLNEMISLACPGKGREEIPVEFLPDRNFSLLPSLKILLVLNYVPKIGDVAFMKAVHIPSQILKGLGKGFGTDTALAV